jgi:hypothetical protein
MHLAPGTRGHYRPGPRSHHEIYGTIAAGVNERGFLTVEDEARDSEGRVVSRFIRPGAFHIDRNCDSGDDLI